MLSVKTGHTYCILKAGLGNVCVYLLQMQSLFGSHTFRCFEKLDFGSDGPERPPGRHCGGV